MSLPYGRVYNFSAGPSCLPLPVLEQAKEDLLNYKGAGMSVMEMSHRSKEYEAIIAEAEADLRTLAGIPDNYKICFLQGGASLQFTMLPMSFLPQGGSADYVVTGTWGKKAIEAAAMLGKANSIFDAKATNYDRAPKLESLSFTEGAAYRHFTSNETIQGVDFLADPESGDNWVCDFSSNILSRPFDVNKYAMIYAGAQKNIGPAGAVVVIIRDDFLAKAPEKTHPMLDYKLQIENGSMYNTPPCWTIYICGLVFKHLLKSGGLSAQEKLNRAKASALYDAIDSTGGFYRGHAQTENRSMMNVTFVLANPELEDAFFKGAKANGLDGIKGHRSVGGCRASIYNAFPQEGCDALAAYMREFAKANG